MKSLKPLFLTLLLGMTIFTVMAQSAPPPPGGAPGGFPIPGIVYALLAAVGYGVYKKFNNPKK